MHKPLPPIIPGVRANHFPHDCLGTRDHSPNTALGPPAPVSLHDGFLYSLVYKQCSGGGGLALGDVNNCYQNKIRQKEGWGSSKFWEHRKNKCEHCRSFQSLYYCKVHCDSLMWNMVECVYWTYLIQTLFPTGSCYWVIALRYKIWGIIVLIRVSQSWSLVYHRNDFCNILTTCAT